VEDPPEKWEELLEVRNGSRYGREQVEQSISDTWLLLDVGIIALEGRVVDSQGGIDPEEPLDTVCAGIRSHVGRLSQCGTRWD
jgi:hypothetical protein